MQEDGGTGRVEMHSIGLDVLLKLLKEVDETSVADPRRWNESSVALEIIESAKTEN